MFSVDANGTEIFIGQFGQQGTIPSSGDFSNPFNLVYSSPRNYFYIADTFISTRTINVIKVFSATGSFLYTIATGKDLAVFSVDLNGTVYLLSLTGKYFTVNRYNVTGTFATSTKIPAAIITPTCLAITSYGAIAIGDSNSHGIFLLQANDTSSSSKRKIPNNDNLDNTALLSLLGAGGGLALVLISFVVFIFIYKRRVTKADYTKFEDANDNKVS